MNLKKGLYVTGSGPGRKKTKIVFSVAAGLLILLAAAVFFTVNRNAPDAKTDDYIQRAQVAYAAGDYEGALALLRRIEDGDPNALLLAAECYEAMGNYERAISMLRQMNTSDQSIASRIQEIEQKRSEKNRADSLTVAGVELYSGDRSASLDGLDITDEQLRTVSELYSLESLSLQDNRITDISTLAALGGLSDLNLAGNYIRDISAVSALRSLRKLNLDHNPVSDCSVLSELRYLNSLSVVDTDVPEGNLRELAQQLPSCAIRYGKDGEEEILIGERSFPLDSEELMLSGQTITDISLLREFRQLKILDLSNNQITDLQPLMELQKLEKLNISNNSVNDLRPLIGLPALTQLDASFNEVTETTAVGSIGSLTMLDLSHNHIRDFSGLGKLNRLNTLKLNATQITDADLSFLYPLKGLANLDLRENEGLSDKEIGTLKGSLTGCSVITSELVYEVSFFGHIVRSDEKKLVYPSCGLWDLGGLDRLTRLEELDLRDNQISSLYQLEITPSRETIRKLNLSGNQIKEVFSLRALTAVEELDLSYNQIQVIAGLGDIKTLKYLNLTGNPVLKDVVDDLREVLPNCVIVF